jgi:hypothetical protein
VTLRAEVRGYTMGKQSDEDRPGRPRSTTRSSAATQGVAKP